MKKLQEPAKISHVIYLAVAVVVVLGGWYTVVQASLVDNPDVIVAPASVEANPLGATNDRQQAFTERLGVELPVDVRCGNTLLPAGETVDSHMIFYNTSGGGITTDANKTWAFTSEILCVMSDGQGRDEAFSNYLLAAPGTVYPGPFPGRGLESGDSYNINGNEITVTMVDEEPGDWIRVITRSLTPTDNQPPFISCEIGANSGGNTPKGTGKGNDEGGLFTFTAVDNEDGPVEISITDTESGQVLGPVPSNSTVKHTVAKGAIPLLRITNNEVDYQLKTQGRIELSATDEAGNTASVMCN